ncbi:hypothetical protein [Bosea psychrotolerans]|uniref:Uncharacterized protein n=1 Tax=Bosea psychrotolerans TaxID=1871628 RepID=A0A2S4LTT2_9HYPH|nr:hypothetical protein [Bosea psychrotolerans]POR45867.1 hypothetical protein CYD53_12935 [Bosea psychrotolerans]
MKFFVHALGAWFAAEAASGRYSRPVTMGIAMLVARLGTPTLALMLGSLIYKKLRSEGAFGQLQTVPARKPRATRG